MCLDHGPAEPLVQRREHQQVTALEQPDQFEVGDVVDSLDPGMGRRFAIPRLADNDQGMGNSVRDSGEVRTACRRNLLV